MTPELVTAGGTTWLATVLVTDADVLEFLGDHKRRFVGTPAHAHRCRMCHRRTKHKGYCERCQKARRKLYVQGYNKGLQRERRRR